jgi:hypothetical protein
MTMLVELARRAVSHPQTATFVKRAVAIKHGQGEEVEVPTWGVVVVYLTVLVGSIAFSLVSYMLNHVITSLCMVESPTAAITVTPSAQEPSAKDGEKETLLETGPTIALVNQKPITSSIRATIRHLVDNAGRFARFRGYRIYILYSFLNSLVFTFFTGALGFLPGQAVLSAAISGALLARVHATWTHRVVGMPTEKTFWQSIPDKSHWKTLAVPAAIASAMPYISMYLTAGLVMLLGFDKMEPVTTCAQKMGVVARVLAVFIFAITCTLFLCLPAMVTRVRVEASILSEDQDTIVPFDRTFGGKVVSKMMGGTGVIGFLDAWRSFNWEARRRLIKLYSKNFFILGALVFVLIHVVAFEVFAIMGPAIGKLMAQMKHDGAF